jgi:hypothetical protein
MGTLKLSVAIGAQILAFDRKCQSARTLRSRRAYIELPHLFRNWILIGA